MPSSRPTLQNIADEVGVCRMTVSRALRNKSCVSSELMKRIHDVAEEMGYKPDPKISQLMSYLRESRETPVRETLGIIHPLPAHVDPSDSKSPTERRLIAGIEKRAEELGYDIDRFTWQAKTMRQKRLRDILEARGIKGIIILGTRVSGEDMTPLAEVTSSVIVGRSNYRTPLALVCNDHYYTMRLALYELMARGYERIGLYIGKGTDAVVSHAWHSIFTYYQNKMQINAPELIALPERVEKEAYQQWLAETSPDVVISNDPGIKVWAEETGLSIPKELGFCQIDWIEGMENCSGVDQNSETIGVAATDLVTHQLMHDERGISPFSKKVMIEGIWREGPSLRRRLREVGSYPNF